MPTKVPLGGRDSQRVTVLASVQLTKAYWLTEHALKDAEEHASLICVAYYIRASLLVKIPRLAATICRASFTSTGTLTCGWTPSRRLLRRCAPGSSMLSAEPASHPGHAATAPGC